MDSGVCVSCRPDAPVRQQIMTQSVARRRGYDEGGVGWCGSHIRYVSERVIRLVCQTGENNRDIECASPGIADGIAPVEERCCPDRGGDDREMGGCRVGVCVYREGEREPRTIPDEMCVWNGEGE